MSKKLNVTVTKRTWWDCSKSWFVKNNGEKSGGEIYSRAKAEETAKRLAENIGGTYDNQLRNSDEVTNELFGL